MTKITEQISLMRSKLEAQRSYHEKAMQDIAREIEALTIIEQSKYLNRDKAMEPMLFISAKNTIKDRMHTAIEKMPPKFTRKELLDCINQDGNKVKVGAGSFSVFFAKFVKKDYIRLVEEGRGNEVSYYAKGKSA